MKHLEKRSQQSLAATALLCAVLVAPSAFANTGSVTINGTVTATTCPTVLINGAASTTVTLPTVSASLLAGGGSAGRTPFSIGVTGCTVSGNTVMNIYFTPTSFNTSGRVSKAVGSTSNNVDVELMSASQVVIDGTKVFGSQYLNQSTIAAGSTLVAGAATQNFYAQYRGNGAAITAGTFTGSFSFTVVYY